MKEFIYNLFNKKIFIENCSCDIDCCCEGNYKFRKKQTINKWFEKWKTKNYYSIGIKNGKKGRRSCNTVRL